MSSTFDPQFHTRIARHGPRSVWVAAPLPATVLPQKAALHRTWRAEECRRLQGRGDIVLNNCPPEKMRIPAVELATSDCA